MYSKISFLFPFLFSLFAYPLSAQNNIEMQTEMNAGTFETDWMAAAHNRVINNTNYLLTETVWKGWDGSNIEKWSYKYDENYHLSESIHESWVDPDWVKRERKTYIYNRNNVQADYNQHWHDSVWVYVTKYSYTYDLNDYLLEKLHQIQSGVNWFDVDKTTYTYNPNNNLIEELFKSWVDNAWLTRDKILYTYDDNNYLIQENRLDWNGVSAWKNFYRRFYAYDINNNLTEVLYQEWEQTLDGPAFVNKYKWINTYDNNNNRIELTEQCWNTDSLNWSICDKILYIYDANNNLIEEDWKYFKILHTYSEITSVKEINTSYDYILAQNYPNPFNPGTKISYSLPHSSAVTIKVYDLIGKEIATLVNEEKPVGSYEVIWNAAGLPSGVYFYQLKGGNFIETKKMILMK